jgi:hypothetical protein
MLTVCIAEDRPSEEVAVKLLVLSITKHCPDVEVVLTFPPATDNFKSFISRFPHVELRTSPIPGPYGWNVKPQALLQLLQEGRDEVWWIDSDIILTCDFRRQLGDFSPSTLLVCEESLYSPLGGYRDDGRRTKAWKFKVGRSLPFCLNSGVMRATRNHIPLLE